MSSCILNKFDDDSFSDDAISTSSSSSLLNNYAIPERKKIVIITGVLGGIGTEVLSKFVSCGWSVVGIDCVDLPMEYINLFYNYFKIDLSNFDSIDARNNFNRSDGNGSLSLIDTFKSIINELPRVDCIVHLAAKQVNYSVVDSPLVEWDNVMSVNLKSIYFLCQVAFDKLKLVKGNIVIITSIHAYQSSENVSLYAISKAALLGLVRNLSIEWAKYGIRINGVAPGAILTNMLLEGLTRRGDDPETALSKLKSKHPCKDIGKTSDISEIIGFLSDNDKAGFITGQTFIVDGGVSTVLSTEN